jgi:ABC-type glycerol-3-phosphate transport system substrate-binding protein
MKRLYGLCFVLALIFAGCGAGNSKPAASVLEPEFFNRKIEREITVSAYESTPYRDFLLQAARAFEDKYPGTKVNVEIFSAMPEVRTMDMGDGHTVMVSERQEVPQGKSDYLNRINTNIMSGTGADIYAMDVIPLHKFIESGTLENLEPYMNGDPEFNRADYRQNILDALHYRGGTWFLPLDYSFQYYAYDSTLVPAQKIASRFGVDKAWSAQELLALGIPLYDGSYKLFNALDFVSGPGGMFYQLLRENMAHYVNLETGRSNFSDGSFARLLSMVSDYAQQGYFPRGITGAQDAEQLMLQVMNAPTDRFFFKLNGGIYLIGQFGRNVGLRFMVATGGTARSIESGDEIAGIQANADGSVPFKYNMAFAVNSQSKNKETAWAFMKFLLSKEIQLSTNPYFLSLNNEAREEQAGLVFSLNNPSRTLNEQQRQALEAYKAAVERLSDSINCYVVEDININDMIIAEAQYFFNGSRNAQEVARVLQNKADLYLSE